MLLKILMIIVGDEVFSRDDAKKREAEEKKRLKAEYKKITTWTAKASRKRIKIEPVNSSDAIILEE